MQRSILVVFSVYPLKEELSLEEKASAALAVFFISNASISRASILTYAQRP